MDRALTSGVCGLGRYIKMGWRSVPQIRPGSQIRSQRMGERLLVSQPGEHSLCLACLACLLWHRAPSRLRVGEHALPLRELPKEPTSVEASVSR